MLKNLVLVLNCGSSSIKFAVVDPVSEQNSFNGLVQCIGAKEAGISWKQDGNKQQQALPNVNYPDALNFILDLIKQDKELAERLFAVGHRVVHGGERFTASAVINPQVLDAIRDCQGLAPLHNPANIAGVEAAQKALPKLPQVAVFDTAFHQTMPKHAFLYAVPYDLYTSHQIRRYGFHGTSHRFVAQQAANLLSKPLTECSFITAHLGNGCSVCAIANGKSVDTSMGLTPLEGLVMGTRSGDIDPSLHAHLVDSLGYDIRKVNNMLNKESGLLGISGIDSDMRAIEEATANGNEQAALAAEIFCYRLAKYIGSYAIPLGQIDALIFTGGIGENSDFIRANTIKWLSLLGFQLDAEQNKTHGRQNGAIITTEGSTKALVIPTNEELMIAQDAIALTN
ncbi:MAG: acetate kinase [Gammaproteobacteria bacterium]|nr:acetate kinase [Gammaproteobacteria bacterium]